MRKGTAVSPWRYDATTRQAAAAILDLALSFAVPVTPPQRTPAACGPWLSRIGLKDGTMCHAVL
jgi:hypothetical protein